MISEASPPYIIMPFLIYAYAPWLVLE